MKLNKLTLLKWLLLIGYVIAAYLFIVKVIRPELHFHLQQPPFLGNFDFFNQYISYPGGISDYIATFCMQFFYYSWIGAMVIVMNALLLMVLARNILKSIHQSESILLFACIPYILSISLLNSYAFPYSVVIKILFTYFLISIYLLNKNGKLSVFIYILLVTLCYYVAGSGSFLIFSGTVFIVELFRNRSKKNLLYLLFVIAFALLIPYISYNYVFNIPQSAKYFYFLPDLPKFIDYTENPLYYIFCFSLPILTLLYILIPFQPKTLVNSIRQKKWYGSNYFKYLVFAVFIITISITATGFTKNQLAKNKLLADYYSYTEQWDKLIDIAMTDAQYDVFINYNYNRAISNTSNFVDSYFNYTQLIGSDGLYPDKFNSNEIALISSDYYYDIGYIGLSRLWANEALTVYPYSPRVLQRLFTTNLILGNYDEAKTYLYILNENFVNRNFVIENTPYLEDTLLISKNNVLMEKRQFMPVDKDFSENMPDRYNDLLHTNINNKMAYDHLQMYFLLKHKLEEFYRTLQNVKLYYKKLPEIYEQALILYLAKTGKPDLITNQNFSETSLNTFSEYTNTLKKYQNNKNAAQSSLKNQFGNTYLYYIMYDSPLVTKFELKGQTINTHKY